MPEELSAPAECFSTVSAPNTADCLRIREISLIHCGHDYCSLQRSPTAIVAQLVFIICDYVTEKRQADYWPKSSPNISAGET